MQSSPCLPLRQRVFGLTRMTRTSCAPLQIPVTYPTASPELALPELDGKTAKMYRCESTCLPRVRGLPPARTTAWKGLAGHRLSLRLGRALPAIPLYAKPLFAPWLCLAAPLPRAYFFGLTQSARTRSGVGVGRSASQITLSLCGHGMSHTLGLHTPWPSG